MSGRQIAESCRYNVNVMVAVGMVYDHYQGAARKRLKDLVNENWVYGCMTADQAEDQAYEQCRKANVP